MISIVTSSVNIPVIAVGGAGNIQHISDAIQNGGVSAVALGSMSVYQKRNGCFDSLSKREDSK